MVVCIIRYWMVMRAPAIHPSDFEQLIMRSSAQPHKIGGFESITKTPHSVTIDLAS